MSRKPPGDAVMTNAQRRQHHRVKQRASPRTLLPLTLDLRVLDAAVIAARLF